MNQLNDFLHKKLLNLPFNLNNIIRKFLDLNQESRVAIVGGYPRDLLIQEIHNEKKIHPIDLDFVIEGSALSLAKYIKQNIKNVELCLIKEFDIYNTVEMNINNTKVDIASAREEIYTSPGSNPQVKKSTIENDLKRRDFSINSIAFDFSKNALIDLYGGINHIKKKELHLLHVNSIRDDPSRLLRCAKYASRLGFNISDSSLDQAQKIISYWPWKTLNDKSVEKLPPGISIRLRMELFEIINKDNLGSVLSILNDWKVTQLLDKSITINTKYLRGLSWIKRLEGNLILYLIKDSKSLDVICQRFFINTKEKKILFDFLNLKKDLNSNKKEFLNFSPSRWTNFIEEHHLDIETIKLIISEGGIFWQSFFRWLFIYRFIKSKKDGETLKKEGWKPGKEMGKEIKRLRYLEIDKLN
jgi:poly(A) polymerase